MIAKPLIDRACLGAITDDILGRVKDRDPAFVDLAAQHEDTDSLAAWFRSRPQRDDEGLPCDGPKVEACSPPQRLRFDAYDPNCVERATRYVGAAEFIDARPVRRLWTVRTKGGLHTFPTEDGEPVILDPLQSRNALRTRLFRIGRNSMLKSPGLPPDTATRRLRIERLIGTDETRGVRGDLARARTSKAAGSTAWVDGKPIDEAIATYEHALVTYQRLLDELPRNATRGARNRATVALTPTEAVDWIADLAAEPAARFAHGPRRVRKGRRALRGSLVGRPLCAGDLGDIVFVLALAGREARRYGPSGVRIVETTARAVDQLDQTATRHWMDQRTARNGPGLRIGSYRVKPNTALLGALGRVGGRLGYKVGVEALRAKLDAFGISSPILHSVEQELNREGLSLGPFASPPAMLGSLAALTPEALAGRWLAQQF